ncbi:hypothetical protein CC1G_13201 [Coprinopsis cinerea okayama7|uniref:Uncharacterized protein n=1 Tax=Coprinopsis cinerea (strain Okayama-7 / 130 / ATCC MYA-4618 / FGSC 9003) TaxID=240176 RepID=A8PG92_COPC7|nr:hypothetical protein CC1G_13201 [Coprinopsis cinerea okayama7\|eukprot:XP_001841171.2 hypothetical protein CC1G_13201 [Coprinopsis cinerea okayama7\
MQNGLCPELQYFRWDDGDSTGLSDRTLLKFMRSRSGNVYYHDSRVVYLQEFAVTLQREQQFAFNILVTDPCSARGDSNHMHIRYPITIVIPLLVQGFAKGIEKSNT